MKRLFLTLFSAISITLYASEQVSAGTVSGLIEWNRIPIHAGLGPDGRVVTFGATSVDSHGGYENVIVDPRIGFGQASRILKANGITFNSFCVGGILNPATLEVIMAGGNSNTDAGSFSSYDERVYSFARMAYPRWYGTVTTLPSGEVMMNGGAPAYGNQDNASEFTEIYKEGEGWRVLFNSNQSPMARGYGTSKGNPFWYPHVFPINEHEVFILAGKYSYILDHRGDGSVRDSILHGRPNWGATSTSVMIRPGKIMQIGGGSRGNNLASAPGSNQATIYDFNQPGAPQTQTFMNHGRHWATSTLLANGELLVSGGANSNNENSGWHYETEIYNPDTNEWRIDATLNRHRLYHSVALLMKDGRVFIGGGGVPGPTVERNAEVYTPDYLLNDDGTPAIRPAITDAPSRVTHGQSFDITTDKAISRLTLLKTGVVTHSFNTDQRFFELSFSGSNGNYQTTFPNDRINATPGLYMVFAFDRNGIASEGKFIRLPGVGDDGASAANDLPTADAALWTFCSDEGSICAVPGNAVVKYGANGQYVEKEVNGSVVCDNTTFTDPVFGTIKSCAYKLLPSTDLPAVTLYEGPNYTGAAWGLTEVGRYDIAQLNASPVGNDSISSIRVSPGYKVVACKDQFFQGVCRQINSSVIVLNGFNNQISSLEVIQVRKPDPEPVVLELSGQVADFAVYVDTSGAYTAVRLATNEEYDLEGVDAVTLVDISETYDIETVRSVAQPKPVITTLELPGQVDDYAVYVDGNNIYTIVRLATGEVISLEGITEVIAIDLNQTFDIAEVEAAAVPKPSN